jgi:hypothetical protein
MFAVLAKILHAKKLLLLPDQGRDNLSGSDSYQAILREWTKRCTEDGAEDGAGDGAGAPPGWRSRALRRIVSSSFRKELCEKFGKNFGETEKDHNELLKAVSTWAKVGTEIDCGVTVGVNVMLAAIRLEQVHCPDCERSMQRCSMQMSRGDEASTYYWRCEMCLKCLDERKRPM